MKRIAVVLAAALVVFVGAACRSAAATLNHVGIVVPDMAKAASDFRAAGFSVGPVSSISPGVVHAPIPFADGTYFELLAASRRTPEDSDIFDAAKHGPGALFAGFQVSNINMQRSQLIARGFRMDPVEARPFGWTLSFSEPAGVMEPFFYITYHRSVAHFRQTYGKYMKHRNGATSLRAIKLGVRKPEDAGPRFALAFLTAALAVQAEGNEERIMQVEVGTSTPAMRGKTIQVDGLQILFR